MQRYQCFANSCGWKSTMFYTSDKKLSSWRLNHLASDSCSSGMKSSGEKKSLCSPSTCWTDLCDVNYPTVEGTKTNWWLRFNPFETYQKQPSDVSSFPPQSGRGRKWKKKTCTYHEIQIGHQRTSFYNEIVESKLEPEESGVETIWVFPKMVVPQIIHFDRVFHYKPSILGYPNFWKHPYHLSSENIKRKTNLHRRPISITCFFSRS